MYSKLSYFLVDCTNALYISSKMSEERYDRSLNKATIVALPFLLVFLTIGSIVILYSKVNSTSYNSLTKYTSLPSNLSFDTSKGVFFLEIRQASVLSIAKDACHSTPQSARACRSLLISSMMVSLLSAVISYKIPQSSAYAISPSMC